MKGTRLQGFHRNKLDGRKCYGARTRLPKVAWKESPSGLCLVEVELGFSFSLGFSFHFIFPISCAELEVVFSAGRW